MMTTTTMHRTINDYDNNDDNNDDLRSESSSMIDALLNDDGTTEDSWRANRVRELQAAAEAAAAIASAPTHGSYDQVAGDRAVLQLTTTLPRVVVHFAHRDYRLCKVMDTHLAAIAPLHPHTRFARVVVEDAPFLVAKLSVRVLPCVVVFVDGVSKQRLVGFDGVGGAEDVPTTQIEQWLQRNGAFLDSPTNSSTTKTKKSSRMTHQNDVDGDSDA